MKKKKTTKLLILLVIFIVIIIGIIKLIIGSEKTKKLANIYEKLNKEQYI